MTTNQESVKQILSLLPGVDCGGGCGFPTCQACAEAIADDGSPALCKAVSSEAVAAIARIMNVKPVETEDKVAFLRCAGTAASSERFAGAESCDEARSLGTVKREWMFCRKLNEFFWI